MPPPGPRRRSPERVLGALDGKAEWADLRRSSTQHALRAALDRGSVVRVGRGRYALPEQSDARLAAAAVGGVLSHLSAAAELGWPVLHPPSAVHVTVPRNAHRRAPPGVVLHRADLPHGDRRRIATRPLRTVLDCATALPFAEALAVADSALRSGLVFPEELQEAASGRRGRGAPRITAVTSAADDRAANPFESALRAILLHAGITGFIPQHPVRLATGRTVLVDLGDPQRRIAVEADSFAWHGHRNELREDCRRYDELVRVGWLVLRVAWEHVLGDPEWVATVVADVVRRRTRRAG